MKKIFTAFILLASTTAIAECININGQIFCSKSSVQSNLINQILEMYNRPQPQNYPAPSPTYIYQQNRDGSTTFYPGGVTPGNFNPPPTDWMNSIILK